MLVQVEYNALLRKGAGVAMEHVQVPDGTTMNRLIDQLCQQHGPAFAAILCAESGNRGRDLLLFLNDQQVAPEDDPVLPPGGTVAILTPISGG